MHSINESGTPGNKTPFFNNKQWTISIVLHSKCPTNCISRYLKFTFCYSILALGVYRPCRKYAKLLGNIVPWQMFWVILQAQTILNSSLFQRDKASDNIKCFLDKKSPNKKMHSHHICPYTMLFLFWWAEQTTWDQGEEKKNIKKTKTLRLHFARKHWGKWPDYANITHIICNTSLSPRVGREEEGKKRVN